LGRLPCVKLTLFSQEEMRKGKSTRYLYQRNFDQILWVSRDFVYCIFRSTPAMVYMVDINTSLMDESNELAFEMLSMALACTLR
jgi:hypothetical protein